MTSVDVYMSFSKNPYLDPSNSRWRTAAILQIVVCPKLSSRFFSEILHGEAESHGDR